MKYKGVINRDILTLRVSVTKVELYFNNLLIDEKRGRRFLNCYQGQSVYTDFWIQYKVFSEYIKNVVFNTFLLT